MRRFVMAAVFTILSLLMICSFVKSAMEDILPDSQLTPELAQLRHELFAKRPWYPVVHVGFYVLISGFFAWQLIYVLRKIYANSETQDCLSK